MKKLLLNIISIIFLLITVIIISYSFIKYPFSNDSYLHLGVGKYIATYLKVPNHSDISFKKSLPAFEFIPHSWFADLLIYEANSLGNYGSIALLILMMSASVFMALNILTLINTPKTLKWVAIGLCLLIAPVFYKIHPFIFSIFFLLFLVRIHIGWIKGEKNQIFYLPLIFLALSNLSGGFIFLPGIFLLFIFLFETVGLFLKTTEAHRYLKLTISIILSFFASLINPLMYRIWLYAMTFFIVFVSPNKETSQLAYTLKLINQNYLKENISSSLYIIFLFYLLFVIGAFIFILIRDGKKFINQTYHYIPYIFLFIFPLIWIRFIPTITFMTIPFFVIILIYIEDHNLKGKYALLKITAAFILVMTAVYLLIYPPTSLEFNPPKTQIELINKYNLPDNVMTSFDITGYKFFSNINEKGYIDAQDDLFDENETINLYSYTSALPGNYLSDMFKRNNINTVIAAKDSESLIQPLVTDNSWSVLYLDFNGILFVKKSLLPSTFIENNSLKYVDLSRKLGFDPQKSKIAAEELKIFTKKYPDSVLATGQLASIYRIEGQFNLAEKTLLKIPKNKWNYIVKIEMGRIKAAQGLCVDSEYYFLDALKERHEQYFSRAILDLAVLYAGCFGDKVKAQHFFQRYISFPIDRQERELVRELAQKFGITVDNSN